MALTAGKVSNVPVLPKGITSSRSFQTVYSFGKSTPHNQLLPTNQRVEFRQASNGHLLASKLGFSDEGLSNICGKPIGFIVFRRSSILCWSTGTRNSKEKECIRPYGDSSDVSSAQNGEEEDKHPVVPRIIHSSQGLAEACKFVYNDAKFVNERARSDIVLLSRSIMRLDARARQDVAILGSKFLKLDARAREDTEKIDRDVKQKAERLHHIATILKDKAQSRLKRAADKHWSDGALEADLRLADFRAKQRAMEDALMALEFVKNILDMMVSKMYKFPLCREKNSLSGTDMMERITLEKNGKTLEFFLGEVSTDRITAIQEVYWSMASALSEADGIDYTDPEELELLIATLIDLDAMDGKSSVSLLAECSSSPDVSTRRALANALAAAPSMWTLGNAGMGALQRLAEDSNPAVAVAASKAIYELKKQWEIEEGDSWRFMMNLKLAEEADSEESSDDADTN
ncbi:senescence-associated protein AAF, chlorolplastic isoform X1 [Pistacia vera]|uniref:senescence-associated protein AAF, chlorolplastic isoform X1 n=1 Tax=Pistacia vera TaxID=55513 RepID=UPI0012631FB8|nr:senescence-associated protein AAF, chlorolplastic isoform X1 [Pistacia vera]XP_031257927.1 senescence-associated protein AAF, chlorolplastic isoform X1 [Pistacia vera]